MYLLNPYHIEAHLKAIGNNAINNVKIWANDTPLNSSFEITEVSFDTTSKRIIKLYDLSISAGIGNSIEDNDIPYVEYETENLICDFALKISGDSMEPKIPDGCVVLIKSCETLAEGRVGAFNYDGKGYCKKLSYVDGTTTLVSINPNYPPIVILEEDTIKLYGEVIEIV